MTDGLDLENSIIAAIRRIVRAIDVQSRQLSAKCGLTGPQLLTLRAIERSGPLSLSVLAKEVSIGQATITGIVDRLERGGWVARARDERDRRRVTVTVTEAGREVLESAPPLLQDRFRSELEKLSDWEQSSMLSTLQRVAAMMDADDLETSPLLLSENEAPANGTRESDEE